MRNFCRVDHGIDSIFVPQPTGLVRINRLVDLQIIPNRVLKASIKSENFQDFSNPLFRQKLGVMSEVIQSLRNLQGNVCSRDGLLGDVITDGVWRESNGDGDF